MKVIKRHIKRYFEALKGKDYKTAEEAVDDAKYQHRDYHDLGSNYSV